MDNRGAYGWLTGVAVIASVFDGLPAAIGDMRVVVAVGPLTDPAIVDSLAAAGLPAVSVPLASLRAAVADDDVAACIVSLASRDDVARIYALKRWNPDVAVLGLAEGIGRTDVLVDAVGFGAGVALARHPAEIVAPLRALLRGETVVPRSLLAVLIDAVFDRVPARYTALHLSRQEAAACELLEQGLPTAAIADTLAVTPTTARRHIGRAMHKAGAHNRGELLTALRAASHS